MGIDQATTFFFTQGILGVIVVVLGFVIVLQDRRSRKDVKDATDTISVLQEKRVADSNIYSEKFIKTSETLLTQMKEAMTLIQGNQRAIETIANILQNMKK